MFEGLSPIKPSTWLFALMKRTRHILALAFDYSMRAGVRRLDHEHESNSLSRAPSFIRTKDVNMLHNKPKRWLLEKGFSDP